MNIKRLKIVFILLILVCILPVRVKLRQVIVAKTPMVVPAKVVIADKFLRKYEGLISEASEEFDVPASLIAAVIRAESDFNPYAVSRAGAMGLMQIMPETWEYLGGDGSPFIPSDNIRYGAKYLRGLMDQFNGNLRLTIAAYNAGPGAVMRYRNVPPYRETRNYVPRVLKYFRKYSREIG